MGSLGRPKETNAKRLALVAPLWSQLLLLRLESESLCT